MFWSSSVLLTSLSWNVNVFSLDWRIFCFFANWPRTREHANLILRGSRCLKRSPERYGKLFKMQFFSDNLLPFASHIDHQYCLFVSLSILYLLLVRGSSLQCWPTWQNIGFVNYNKALYPSVWQSQQLYFNVLCTEFLHKAFPRLRDSMSWRKGKFTQPREILSEGLCIPHPR